MERSGMSGDSCSCSNSALPGPLQSVTGDVSVQLVIGQSGQSRYRPS